MSTLSALYTLFRPTANRRLAQALWIRETTSRYRGSLLGLLWSFITPLANLLLYLFVFVTVLKARWDGDTSSNATHFGLMVFCGMLVHGVFAEVISLSPALLPAHANYVKKVQFPLALLPSKIVAGAMTQMMCGLSLLLGLNFLLGGHASWNMLALPVLLACIALIAAALAWVLSAIGCYVRDLQQGSGLLVSVLMFASPVVYPISMVPEKLRFVLYLNPLTWLMETMRAALLTGATIHLSTLLYFVLGSLVAAELALRFFRRVESGFADGL